MLRTALHRARKSKDVIAVEMTTIDFDITTSVLSRIGSMLKATTAPVAADKVTRNSESIFCDEGLGLVGPAKRSHAGVSSRTERLTSRCADGRQRHQKTSSWALNVRFPTLKGNEPQ